MVGCGADSGSQRARGVECFEHDVSNNIAMGSVETMRPWEITVQEKRDARERAVEPYLSSDQKKPAEPRYGNILDRSWIEPETARNLTDVNDIQQLLGAYQSGKVTVVDVIEAYCRRLRSANETECMSIGRLIIV